MTPSSTAPLQRAQKRKRSGISLVEVSVSTVIVGLIIVGAMRCLASATQSAESTVDHSAAILLAEDLMEEILQQDYSEPTEVYAFGRELTEPADSRTLWDDVDDYDGWTSNPPLDEFDQPVAESEWTRSVTVQHVLEADLNAVQSDASDTGVKRVTVQVHQDGKLMAELVGIQTKGWISSIPDYSQASTTGRLPPVNLPPVAHIDATPVSGTGSITVSLDATASSDPEDDPLEYTWSIEGESFSGAQISRTLENATDQTISVAVTLTVQDLHGATDQASVTITIHPNR